MSFFNFYYSLKFEIVIIVTFFQFINNFLFLPFETINIKDEAITGNGFHSNLMQNELYTNLSIGIPKQDFKAILKMDVYGFLMYEGALKYNLSTSYESIDEDIYISYLYNFTSLSSKDHFYLSSFNSYNDFYNFIKNNNKEKNYNITKTNKAKFLRIQPAPNSSYFFNTLFNDYGVIGLKYNLYDNTFNVPEFIISLKEVKSINSYSFSFKYEQNLKNGFTDSNNKGYFIIGEELVDNEKEKEEIKYVNCERIFEEIKWNLRFDNIYSKVNANEYNRQGKLADLIINYPFLIGGKEYFKFINESFFNELLEKKICYVNNFIKYTDKYTNFYSYACDSKSKYFMEKLNSFPDLVFEHKQLEVKFTLTKNDLFSFNYLDDSDTNLYFLIIGDDLYYEWVLGIPFLKKYRLSFNYDKKNIGYYKNDGKIIDNKVEDNKSNFFGSIYFKLIIIVILVIIVLLFGMFIQKNLQKTRKKKANELDDNYEYESYKEKINNEKDNNNGKIVIDSINY